MTKKDIVAIDIDEVKANFISSLLAWHSGLYNTNFKKSDIWAYNLWELWGISQEEAITRVHAFYKTPEFKIILPVKGAQQGIKRLTQKYSLVSVSSRPRAIESETAFWLSQMFPGMLKGLYLTGQYSLAPRKTKRQICKDLGARVKIEDSLEHAQNCALHVERVLLFDNESTYGWNQTNELPKRIERVHT